MTTLTCHDHTHPHPRPFGTAATLDKMLRRDYHDASGTFLTTHYLKPEDDGQWPAVPPGADPKGTVEGKPTAFGDHSIGGSHL